MQIGIAIVSGIIVVIGIGFQTLGKSSKAKFIGILIILFGTLGGIIAGFIADNKTEMRHNEAQVELKRYISETYNNKSKALEDLVQEALNNDSVSLKYKEEIENKVDDLNEWGSENIPDFDSVILQMEKRKLVKREQELEYNKKWVPIYFEIFNQFEEVIDRYNAENNDSVQYLYSEKIPKDLFNYDKDSFYFSINFYDIVIYKVHIYYITNESIFIKSYSRGDDNGSLSLSITKGFDSDYIQVLKGGIFDEFPLRNKYEYDKDMYGSMKEAFRDLLYYQIKMLKEK